MSRRNVAGYIYKQNYWDKKTGEKKTSKVWWICYRHNGKKYRESSKSSKEAVARALLKERIGRAGLGKPVAPAVRRTTLNALAQLVFDDYEKQGRDTRRRQVIAWNWLREFRGGDVLAEEVTTQWIDNYIKWRRQQPDKRANKSFRTGCATASINRELAALRRAFSLAARNNPPLVANVPFIGLMPERNRRKNFFEWEQFQAVCEHLPPYLKPVMTVAYYTGWRAPSELLTRQKHHIVDGMLILEAEEGKNEEPRMFPLDIIPELRETIERQLEATRALEIETGQVIPWLFHNQGNPIRDYRDAWGSACKAAGIPGRLAHDFRRTAARDLINSGVDPFTAMKLVGWESMEMLKRYNIIDQNTLKAAVVKRVAHLDVQKKRPSKVVSIRG